MSLNVFYLGKRAINVEISCNTTSITEVYNSSNFNNTAYVHLNSYKHTNLNQRVNKNNIRSDNVRKYGIDKIKDEKDARDVLCLTKGSRTLVTAAFNIANEELNIYYGDPTKTVPDFCIDMKAVLQLEN